MSMARTRGILDWFRPPESKTLHPVWWDYVERSSPLEWSSRPPYMAGGLGFPFEVAGPSSRSVTDFRKVAFCNYREDPMILGSTGGAATMI
jgi:hypothetical protein